MFGLRRNACSSLSRTFLLISRKLLDKLRIGGKKLSVLALQHLPGQSGSVGDEILSLADGCGLEFSVA